MRADDGNSRPNRSTLARLPAKFNQLRR